MSVKQPSISASCALGHLVVRHVAHCVMIGAVLCGMGECLFAQIDPTAKYDVVPIHPRLDIRLPEGLDKAADPEAYRQAMDKYRQAVAARSDQDKIVKQILFGTIPLTGEESRFRGWFEQVIFAEMTQTDQQSLLAIPKKRHEFFRDYLQKKGIRPEVHDELVKLTLTRMRQIAKGNYHPAARFNAMLIIGQLNAREPVLIGEGQSPPIPYLPALVDLVREYENPDQIDAVRVAALIGLLRHARLDGQRREDQRMDLRYRYRVMDDMLKLVQAKDPPPGRTFEGHRWMQRRAVEILGALRDVGAANAVAKELESIISDQTYSLPFRFTAAGAYGQLNFPNPKAVHPFEMVRKISSLTSLACRQELERLQQERQQLKEKFALARGVSVENIEEDEVKLDQYKLTCSRRLLKSYIQYAQKAVGTDEDHGLWRYSTAEPEATFVPEVANAFKELMKATDKAKQAAKLDAPLLAGQVDHYLRELDKLLLTAGAKAAAASAKPPAGAAPAELPGGELPGALPGGLPGPALPGPADPLAPPPK